MAAPANRHLSALADRCRSVDFVFATAGCDRQFSSYLAQTRVRRRRISRLFFCFRLFHSGLAACIGIDRQLHFSFFFGLRSFPIPGQYRTAGTGWHWVGSVFKFYHSKGTLVTIEPLCRIAADPWNGELATDFGI